MPKGIKAGTTRTRWFVRIVHRVQGTGVLWCKTSIRATNKRFVIKHIEGPMGVGKTISLSAKWPGFATKQQAIHSLRKIVDLTARSAETQYKRDMTTCGQLLTELGELESSK